MGPLTVHTGGRFSGIACFLMGCYVTQTVAPESLRAVGQSLGGSTTLADKKGASVPLRPTTIVRARYHDESHSAWYQAGDLMVLPEGLALMPLRNIDEAREVLVRGLTQAQLTHLTSLAPAGGRLDHRQMDWMALVTNTQEERVAWITRFIRETPRGTDVPGVWSFFGTDRDWPPTTITGAALARAAPRLGDVQAAKGMRWQDVEVFELRYLDPIYTLVWAPALPALILWGLVFASLGADDLDGNGGDSSRPLGGSTKSLAVCKAESARGASLFEGVARRRGLIRGLSYLETAASLGGDIQGGATVGARFEDLYEITFLFRGISSKDGPTRANDVAVGFGLGLHAEPTPGRWALVVGVQGGTTLGSQNLMWLTARLGPRWPIKRTAFVTLLPIMPAFRERQPRTGEGSWRFFSGVELGFAW